MLAGALKTQHPASYHAEQAKYFKSLYIEHNKQQVFLSPLLSTINFLYKQPIFDSYDDMQNVELTTLDQTSTVS